jgi:GAF domain-containing protein
MSGLAGTELSALESERLKALESYGVLDTDFEESFDRITRLAAHLFGTPISLVSLVDRHRQWFKSSIGLNARETSRDVAFCAHAIQKADVFVVTDATADERFSNNPLVTGDPGIRFYAGAPLRTREGYALGTICVIDHIPRNQLTEEMAQALKDFADLVVELLEYRKAARQADRIIDEMQEQVEKVGKASSRVRQAALSAGQLDDEQMISEIRLLSRNLSLSVTELKAALANLPRVQEPHPRH